jgi:hypothetical protein
MDRFRGVVGDRCAQSQSCDPKGRSSGPADFFGVTAVTRKNPIYAREERLPPLTNVALNKVAFTNRTQEGVFPQSNKTASHAFLQHLFGNLHELTDRTERQMSRVSLGATAAAMLRVRRDVYARK